MSPYPIGRRLSSAALRRLSEKSVALDSPLPFQRTCTRYLKKSVTSLADSQLLQHTSAEDLRYYYSRAPTASPLSWHLGVVYLPPHLESHLSPKPRSHLHHPLQRPVAVVILHPDPLSAWPSLLCCAVLCCVMHGPLTWRGNSLADFLKHQRTHHQPGRQEGEVPAATATVYRATTGPHPDQAPAFSDIS